MPLLGLGISLIRRRKPSVWWKIRATPRMFFTGGSLGCIVSCTPAFSAASTIGLAK